MNRCRFLFCLTFSFLMLVGIQSADAQVAHLTLQSQPGDFIGQGGNFDITYTPVNSQFFLTHVERTVGSPPVPAFLDFTLGSPTSATNTFATLDFATDQLGIAIQPGFYPNAQRAFFASSGHPGLSVAFQNRGSNTLTGNFTVTDATFGPNNLIQTFGATFEQHSEGAASALFGTFTYNAIPEPSALALVACGTVVLLLRRASKSLIDRLARR